MTARTLDAYLNSAGGLSRLSTHAGRLVKLQHAFGKIAPAYLLASSRVANFKSGKVIIHADSGAVAAKLRQILPSLAEKFSLEGAEITEIQVKVQPSYVAAQQENRGKSGAAAPLIGATAKAGLQGLADDLPDSALKAALERLVSRSR